MNQLVAERVAYAYGGRRVVDGVSLTLSPGEIVALVGPSGSGKTTLLSLLAGLREPQDGRVEWRGLSPGQRPRVGVALQPPGLWDHLPAWRHLDLVLRGQPLSHSERRHATQDMLNRFGLGDAARRRPGELSSGERQRLSLARALVIRPEWLLIDEPVAHLDPAHRRGVLDAVRQSMRETGAGGLIVTHHGAEAMRIADRLGVLLDGQLVQIGSPAEVYTRPATLPAALLLGDAAELEGEAKGGTLYRDGRALVHGLCDRLTGPTRLILRPAQVTFAVHADGPWVATACDFAGNSFVLTLEDGDARLLAASATPHPPGTRGRVTLAGHPTSSC